MAATNIDIGCSILKFCLVSNVPESMFLNIVSIANSSSSKASPAFHRSPITNLNNIYLLNSSSANSKFIKCRYISLVIDTFCSASSCSYFFAKNVCVVLDFARRASCTYEASVFIFLFFVSCCCL